MQPDFQKYSDGLIPSIVQDNITGQVLMLGFMNEEAVKKTIEGKRVCFFSRSKNRLWTKGEESGNYLELISLNLDCDNDTILIKAKPFGPVCHTGSDTCWDEKNESSLYFLKELEKIIENRKKSGDEKSYVRSLLDSGINKVAQKVGEEAVELVIEAKDTDEEKFLGEAADLLFHYLILLQAKNHSLMDVLKVLEKRNKK